MLEVERDLPDVEPGAERVDRHPRLDAEAGRHREHRRPRVARQQALTGERLVHAPSAATLDERSGNALREPDPAAHPARERGDGEVAAGVGQRTQVAAQVGVAEEERPVATRRLGERQRLALPATRQADDPRARRLGTVCRCVVRAVVGDDDLCVRERLAERRDGRSDHVLLVAGGDEHGERRAHSSVGVGTGGASGRTPSTASGPIP